MDKEWNEPLKIQAYWKSISEPMDDGLEFVLKLVFRLVHISSAILFIGSTFADTIYGIDSIHYAKVQSICGVLLLVSGLTNLKLLKPKQIMGNFKGPWMRIIHSKLLLWITLLPLPEIVFSNFQSEFPRNLYNQILCIVLILMSTYSKQHRDWAIIQNKTLIS